MAFQAGSIFAEMELDAAPLVKGLKDASKAIDDFAKSVKEKIEKAGGKPVADFGKRIKELGTRFKTLSKNVIGAFNRISSVAKGSFKFITAPFRALIGFLTKSIFNLKNLCG